MSNPIHSSLRAVSGKLRDLASDIVNVRTGTVVSNYAAMSNTVVTLDQDPDSTHVQALSLNGKLAKGSRVLMLAYPPQGLVIMGQMSVAAAFPTLNQFITNTTIAYPGAQYTYLMIEGCGGGGAGGGSATSTAGASSMGGGGGAGMYCRSLFRVDSTVWPLTLTIVGAGSGIAAAAGGNGGRSTVTNGNSVKIWCAEGGVGGGFSANAVTLGGSAAGGTGAADNLTQFLGQTAYFGGGGERALRVNSSSLTGGTGAVAGGQGGASYFGGGAPGGANSAGSGAQPPGAGGGGASSFNTGGGNLAGGSGGPGMIVTGLT